MTERPVKPVPTIVDDGGVKWLLSGLLLRKIVSIAKSLLSNELDLRDWMSPSPAQDHSDGTETWFDFLADTGDDPYIMERLAIAANTAYAANDLSPIALPRGKFLVLGGDTAYVTPDEPTLRYRFVEPFDAAYLACGSPESRPIYAIPGNHDYYDALVGFNRMFRLPLAVPQSRSPLPIAGHTTSQDASYFKILLPGGWELWAVDVGHHGLDYRQRKYFRPSDAFSAPTKLIICTHAPVIASDQFALNEIESKAYSMLLAPETPAFTPTSTGGDTCRLFLAGHVHHYARYDGQKNGAREPTRSATVVAGAGGSFIHPTEHRCGPIEAAIKYPDPASSRELSAAALTKPWKIIDGGYVWLLGVILAVLFHLTWPRADTPLKGPIAWAATVFACFGVVIGGVSLLSVTVKRRVHAAKVGRTVPGAKPHPNGRRLASAIVPASIAIALVLPFVSHAVIRDMDPLAPASVWLTLGVGLIVGLGAVGLIAGAPPHPIGFTVIGAIHGGLQLVIPHLLVCRGWGSLGATFAVWFVLAYVGRKLYTRRHRYLLIVWWLAQGVGVACLLFFAPWPPVRVDGWDLWLLVIVAGAIASAIQFGHYLLVVSAWDGHCNETGITARSKNYKQWIRFHVQKESLTGYVIGLDDPDAKPRVVDVFTIGPPAQLGGG